MNHDPIVADVALAERCQFFHDAMQAWLADPDIMIACGRWSEGAIGELMPQGRGRLLPPAYGGQFVGIRELWLDDAPHHLPIDFGRVHCLRYVVAPSVCFGFKPSFEVRLLVSAPGGAPSDGWVIALMLSCPYDRGELALSQVRRFLQRAREHAAARPDLVEFDVEATVRTAREGERLRELLRELTVQPGAEWPALLAALVPPIERRAPAAAATDGDPLCRELFEQALKLRDASLVAFREHTLVELKTERLRWAAPICRTRARVVADRRLRRLPPRSVAERRLAGAVLGRAGVVSGRWPQLHGVVPDHGAVQ